MKQKFLFLTSFLTLFLFGFSGFALAGDSELLSLVKSLQKEMQKMQQTIESQNQKIAALENRQASISTPPAGGTEAPVMTDKEFEDRLGAATGTGGANKWLKDLKFSGDMRLRYEAFHYAGSDAPTDDRNRFRYRLRYGFEKTYGPQMKMGFALASGEQSGGANVDPNSTNTSFDNNFNFKPIFIERAYATYTPNLLANRGILKSTEITAGKMVNPFEKGSSDMVWDRDVRPEGIYEKINLNLFDSDSLSVPSYITAGQFVLDEDATNRGDANLYAFQTGIEPTFRIGDAPVRMLHAFSYYDFNNYARGSNFFIGTTSLARTNPNVDGDATELDAGKFRVFEYYTELGFNVIVPVTLSYDVAANPADEASASNTVLNEHFAQGFGIKLNGLKKKGDWELSYQYKWIGANAVPAGFNDSDFGDGFTSKAGSVIRAGYALTDSLSLNFASYWVSNLNTGTAGSVDQPTRRFQLDLMWKF